MVMPLHATFGLGDSWAAIWSKDGSGTMIELDKKYAVLRKDLESNPNQHMLNIFLDPCSNLEEFLIFCPNARGYKYLQLSRLALAQELTLNWYQDVAQVTNTNISMASQRDLSTSTRFIGPGDAAKAEKARETQEAQTPVEQVDEATKLPTKHSGNLSSVAVIGVGLGCCLMGCNVM